MNDKIIERIAKLLEVASHGSNDRAGARNEHEAANAAAMAQELMQAHDLDMATVSAHVDKRTGGGTGIVEQPRVTLRKKGKPGSWKVELFQTVGRTSDCWVYIDPARTWWDTTGYMIGRKQDVEMAMYVYEFLVRELERLQKVYGDERWAELRETAREYGVSTHTVEQWLKQEGRHPLKSKESWIKGATVSVIRSLRDAKRSRDAASAAAGALVINKLAERREWWAKNAGYATWEEYEAATKAEADALIQSAAATPLTDKEKARIEREYERERERERKRLEREADALDAIAYGRGLDDGANITVRPGVRSGEAQEELPMLG